MAESNNDANPQSNKNDDVMSKICLKDMASKLHEHMIKSRIEAD